MHLVITESNGKYSWSAYFIRLNKKGASRSINKGIKLPGAEIINYTIQGYHTGPVVGLRADNFDCNRLPPKPSEPSLKNRIKHAGRE